jgi:hypothetical protein|tara:strand:- start:451 stop:1005 length:555 start_codon:yes stop_codon:yes gene_type:complete
MANRVLLGKRGSDHGLFVSQAGDNVISDDNLSFDTRCVGGFSVALKGEGSIVAPAHMDQGGTDFSDLNTTTTATIPHGLDFTPAFAVRWCYAKDLTSSVADRMYHPSRLHTMQIDYTTSTQYYANGGCEASIDGTNLTITNHENGSGKWIFGSGWQSFSNMEARPIYYAYIIFQMENFNGGYSI